MGDKIDYLVKTIKSGDMLPRSTQTVKKRNVMMYVFAGIGAVAAMAAVAYAVYRYMNPDYLDDFDDDFDDYEDDMMDDLADKDQSADASEL